MESMTDEIPSMRALAPLVDTVLDIAREELPAPRTLKIRAYDDGDYDIYAFHSCGSNEREQVVYDRNTGAILWQYRKIDPDWEFPTSDDGEERKIETEYAESEERQITTIEPPAE